MKRLAALLLLLALCACKPPEVIYQRVEVPVMVPCPEPPPFAVGDFPVFHLANKPQLPSDPFDEATSNAYQRALERWQIEVARAYVESFTKAYGQLLEAAKVLDGYRRPTPARKP